jgi:CelD/BcsL family acetyltransferase involved in cellulose biosynthesis
VSTEHGGRPGFANAAQFGRFEIRGDDIAPPPFVANASASVAYEAAVERSTEPLADEWDALADRAGAPAFLRPGWVAAWWQAFGKGALEILTIRQSGHLVGLVPVYRRHGALRTTTNWHTPTFGSLADNSDVAHELARTVFSRAPRRASLAFVDPSGADFDAWRSAARAARYRVLVRLLQRSPFVEVDRDWETYRAGLSRRYLRDRERDLRRLEREGRVALEFSDGRERFDELLAEGLRVEAAAWKGSRGTAIASRPETRRFYRDVGLWAAERGWLRLVFLRVNGRAVAFQYSVQEGGVYHFIKGGYDPAFRRMSPGKLIIYLTLKHTFSTGLARYEMLGDAEPYKLKWASSSRDSVLLDAFAPTMAGLLTWAVHAYGRPLAKNAHLGPAVHLLRR